MNTEKRTLVLLRHGESLWNRENRFTGWKDVDLSDRGTEEALEAGRTMMREGLLFDCAYASCLRRAIRTLWLSLDTLDQMWLPTTYSWRLNERHYGALEGLNKAETTAQYGEAQVKIWRRSFDVPPPPMSTDDPRFVGRDRRYTSIPSNELPLTESLKEVIARVMPLWNESIKPDLERNKTVLVVAHGNTIRALVMHLSKISRDEIVDLNIPTGIPLLYTLDNSLHEVSRRFLGDQSVVAAKIAAVAAQAQKKDPSCK